MEGTDKLIYIYLFVVYLQLVSDRKKVKVLFETVHKSVCLSERLRGALKRIYSVCLKRRSA